MLEAARVVDKDGVRLVGLPGEAEALLAHINLPEETEEFAQEVKNQLKVVWAEHTFSAGFKTEEVLFLLDQLDVQ